MKFYAIQFRVDEETVKTLLLRTYTELLKAKSKIREEGKSFAVKTIKF